VSISVAGHLGGHIKWASEFKLFRHALFGVLMRVMGCFLAVLVPIGLNLERAIHIRLSYRVIVSFLTTKAVNVVNSKTELLQSK
jgi:hypothetical protein